MALLKETYVLSPRKLKKTLGVSCRVSVYKFHGCWNKVNKMNKWNTMNKRNTMNKMNKKAEVKAEEMLKVFLEVDEVSDLRLEDEDFLREAEGYTKQKKDAVALGRIK